MTHRISNAKPRAVIGTPWYIRLASMSPAQEIAQNTPETGDTFSSYIKG